MNIRFLTHPVVELFRHRRRQTVYQLHTEQCRVNVANGLPLEDGEMVFLYRNITDGTWSIRRGPAIVVARDDVSVLPRNDGCGNHDVVGRGGFG